MAGRLMTRSRFWIARAVVDQYSGRQSATDGALLDSATTGCRALSQTSHTIHNRTSVTVRTYGSTRTLSGVT